MTALPLSLILAAIFWPVALLCAIAACVGEITEWRKA